MNYQNRRRTPSRNRPIPRSMLDRLATTVYDSHAPSRCVADRWKKPRAEPPLCAILEHGLREVMTTPNQALCAGFDPALVAQGTHRRAGCPASTSGLLARSECRVSKVLDDFV